MATNYNPYSYYRYRTLKHVTHHFHRVRNKIFSRAKHDYTKESNASAMSALQSLLSPSPSASRFQWKPPLTRGRIYAVASSSPSPKDWVKATDAQFFQTDTRPIMLFDGVCNLCNGGVQFVRAVDPNRRIRYEPLQSKSGKKLLQRSGRSPDDISNVVLVEKDRSYIKSEAVLRIMEHLDLPFPQLALMLKFVPLSVRNFAYDNIANNRYEIFGRSETEACDI